MSLSNKSPNSSTPLTSPTYAAYRHPAISEEHQRRELERLLEGWQHAPKIVTGGETTFGLNHEGLRAAAQRAFAKGHTPYQVLLFVIAPVFCGVNENEVEVIEVDDA